MATAVTAMEAIVTAATGGMWTMSLARALPGVKASSSPDLTPLVGVGVGGTTTPFPGRGRAEGPPPLPATHTIRTTHYPQGTPMVGTTVALLLTIRDRGGRPRQVILHHILLIPPVILLRIPLLPSAPPPPDGHGPGCGLSRGRAGWSRARWRGL